jgi:mannose-6-phosphate isomerase-like protein (cupin superfamily)
MRRTSSTLSLIVFGLVACGVAVGGQVTPWQPPDATGNGQTPIMPVHQEPHHRQVFQRGPMRILDLQVPPGDVSWFHTHEWPVYYLTTSDSPTVSQNLGEEWGAGRRGRGAAPASGPPPAAGGPPPAARGPAPAGRGRPRLMSDLSYAERPNTHRIRNDGPTLFRAMVVVNETGGDETVTEEQAGFADKPISSNKWFRVYRIALGPGEKSPSHQHKAPVVILQDTAGKGIGVGGMTFEFNEPGQWAYFDPGDRHQLTNTGDGRLELIEVEVRRK